MFVFSLTGNNSDEALQEALIPSLITFIAKYKSCIYYVTLSATRHKKSKLTDNQVADNLCFELKLQYVEPQHELTLFNYHLILKTGF